MFTAVGVAAADASDATAADAAAGERLGELPNQLPIDVDAPPLADEATAAASMAVEAAVATASPAVPGGNVSRTLAVDEPGVRTTTTSVAPGYCASIAVRIVATSAMVSGLVNATWVVTARGFDKTAGVAATAGTDDVACPRVGWLANHRLFISATDAPLMAD